MNIIAHRINSIQELEKVNKSYGVEIDLRSNSLDIVLEHEALKSDFTKFEEWLQYFCHEMIILNIKEEGLENRILDILREFKVENYFFLDQSFPFMVKALRNEEKRVAIRISDLESPKAIYNLVKKNIPLPQWIWVDSFSGDWSHLNDLADYTSMGMKICLASPELHGRGLSSELSTILKFVKPSQIDAICTKRPQEWLKLQEII